MRKFTATLACIMIFIATNISSVESLSVNKVVCEWEPTPDCNAYHTPYEGKSEANFIENFELYDLKELNRVWPYLNNLDPSNFELEK